jgi:predicted MFS family arabinose efflux permease
MTEALRADSGPRRHLMREPDFLRLWFVGLVVFGIRWLEMLAVGVFVYQRTGSAFVVAMMTMLRLLPMGLFGAWFGAALERLERRTTLIVVVLSMLTSSVALTTLAWSGHLAVWHLGVASFWNGLAWATDNPVRRVMIGEVAGPDRMGRAMSIDVGSNNASRMLGPTVGGLLLATVGIEGTFSVGVFLYLFALLAAFGLRYRNNRGAPPAGSVLARMSEGFALARRDPRLVGTLIITVIYNVFGWPFLSMVPVIGKDNLHLDAVGVGMLASMDGVGSFLGAIAVALCARPPFFARIYIGGLTIQLALLTVFALVPSPLAAGASLFMTGFGSSGFSIMQATLVYLAAPADMRSRMMGVLSVCIGLGPIGFLLLGTMAELIGAQSATVATGLEGLLVLALTRRWWRGI